MNPNTNRKWCDVSSDSEIDYTVPIQWNKPKPASTCSVDLDDTVDVAFDKINEGLKKVIGKFVFRRCGVVYQRRNDLIGQRFHAPNLDGDDVSGMSHSSKAIDYHTALSSDDIDKRVEYRYRQFQGETIRVALRSDNDPCPGQVIEFYSKDKCTLMVEDGSFRLVPLVHEGENMGYIPPRTHSSESDIICGIVGCNGKRFYYEKWFIASEQLMRAWTLLMYGTGHQAWKAYRKPKDDTPERLRATLMAKNTICGNSYRKMLMAHNQNSLEVKMEDRFSRFYMLRNEFSHCPYVHTYAALVTMCVYHELPTPENVPKTLGNEPKMKQWDLPPQFVERVIALYA